MEMYALYGENQNTGEVKLLFRAIAEPFFKNAMKTAKNLNYKIIKAERIPALQNKFTPKTIIF